MAGSDSGAAAAVDQGGHELERELVFDAVVSANDANDLVSEFGIEFGIGKRSATTVPLSEEGQGSEKGKTRGSASSSRSYSSSSGQESRVRHSRTQPTPRRVHTSLSLRLGSEEEGIATRTRTRISALSAKEGLLGKEDLVGGSVLGLIERSRRILGVTEDTRDIFGQKGGEEVEEEREEGITGSDTGGIHSGSKSTNTDSKPTRIINPTNTRPPKPTDSNSAPQTPSTALIVREGLGLGSISTGLSTGTGIISEDPGGGRVLRSATKSTTLSSSAAKELKGDFTSKAPPQQDLATGQSASQNPKPGEPKHRVIRESADGEPSQGKPQAQRKSLRLSFRFQPGLLEKVLGNQGKLVEEVAESANTGVEKPKTSKRRSEVELLEDGLLPAEKVNLETVRAKVSRTPKSRLELSATKSTISRTKSRRSSKIGLAPDLSIPLLERTPVESTILSSGRSKRRSEVELLRDGLPVESSAALLGSTLDQTPAGSKSLHLRRESQLKLEAQVLTKDQAASQSRLLVKSQNSTPAILQQEFAKPAKRKYETQSGDDDQLASHRTKLSRSTPQDEEAQGTLSSKPKLQVGKRKSESQVLIKAQQGTIFELPIGFLESSGGRSLRSVARPVLGGLQKNTKLEITPTPQDQTLLGMLENTSKVEESRPRALPTSPKSEIRPLGSSRGSNIQVGTNSALKNGKDYSEDKDPRRVEAPEFEPQNPCGKHQNSKVSTTADSGAQVQTRIVIHEDPIEDHKGRKQKDIPANSVIFQAEFQSQLASHLINTQDHSKSNALSSTSLVKSENSERESDLAPNAICITKYLKDEDIKHIMPDIDEIILTRARRRAEGPRAERLISRQLSGSRQLTGTQRVNIGEAVAEISSGSSTAPKPASPTYIQVDTQPHAIPMRTKSGESSSKETSKGKGKDKPLERNIDNVIFGDVTFKAWYPSWYPKEIIGEKGLNGDCKGIVVPDLYVCNKCFGYSKTVVEWVRHTRCCEKDVPGEKIYTHGPSDIWSIWEVDGDVDTLFCQNLSLFAKLFLDNKSVFFDVSGFKYFLLVHTSPTTSTNQIVGFFSKEKMSWDNNNLACILIFPPWQRKSLGTLLMGISYSISKREQILGGPEKPISDLGKKGYKRYWGAEIARWLLTVKESDRKKGRGMVTVGDVSQGTWIVAEDCLTVLRDMGVVERAGRGKGEVERVRVDKEAVRAWVAREKISLERVVDEDGFVEGYAMKDDEEVDEDGGEGAGEEEEEVEDVEMEG